MSAMFSGDTTLTDSHDTVQKKAGSAIWFNEFVPKVERPKKTPRRGIALYAALLGMCGAIVIQYAMFVAGVLPFHPLSHNHLHTPPPAKQFPGRFDSFAISKHTGIFFQKFRFLL
jgi:hypothetical protein